MLVVSAQVMLIVLAHIHAMTVQIHLHLHVVEILACAFRTAPPIQTVLKLIITLVIHKVSFVSRAA